MSSEDKIMEKLQKAEIDRAVTHEKLNTITERLNAAATEFKEIERRVDNHDKIVGAIGIAVAILGALVKFKVI